MKKQKLVNGEYKGVIVMIPALVLACKGRSGMTCYNLNFRSNGLCQELPHRIPFDVGTKVKVTVHLEKRVNLMVSILSQNSLLPLPQHSHRLLLIPILDGPQLRGLVCQ